MIQTLKNAWKVPEIRSKILFTLLVILLYRLGSCVTVPFVNNATLTSFASQEGIFSYMNLLSGGAFGQATVFALNVSPYITSSIVIQLLTVALPPLERWAKDGEAGRKKIGALTRVVTIALALVTAIGYAMLLDNYGVLIHDGVVAGATAKWFVYTVIIACFCAGSSIIMWMAERINEFGIGNGISMILFANILARVPSLFQGVWNMAFTQGGFKGFDVLGFVLMLVSVLITVAIIFMIVWFTESERRIPIQYAKRQVGRKMYGGQASNLPLKMNMAGVMPVIFASSIVSIPTTVASVIPNSGFGKFVTEWLSPTSWIYLVVYVVLILLFSYFYIMISFNPVEVANNIRNQGGAVPGIRPGKPTSDYISRILRRITTLGAIFLIFIAGFPILVEILVPTFKGISFGGTSLLIVVGVALETFRSLESQLAMRNYKGFLD